MGKTYQSTTVNATVDEVWATIRTFHDMSWASSIVSDCKPVGDVKGDQIGAKRVLNDTFHETLLELSDIDHRIRYSIDKGPRQCQRMSTSVFSECPRSPTTTRRMSSGLRAGTGKMRKRPNSAVLSTSACWGI